MPWILALLLLGFGIARTGLLTDLHAHRRRLRTAGAAGPAALGAAFAPDPDAIGSAMLLVAAMALGAPLLAIGYLAVLTLWFQRRCAPGRLASIGRMALSAYLAQSALALTVFAGLGRYGRTSAAQALIVVVAIWASH